MTRNIWDSHYTIRSYEVDRGGCLSIVMLAHFLQDAASNHAHHLGVSIQQQQAENFTWVLSRMHIKVSAYPQWKDKITVQTWPSGGKGLFAFRDFLLHDHNGQPIASAASAWLILDLGTRRAVRIAPFLARLKPVDLAPVLSDKLLKLSSVNDYDYQGRFQARYRDLDANDHVNNVSYIAWALESIPLQIRSRFALSEIKINFLGEAFWGNTIAGKCKQMEADEDQKLFSHSLFQKENGAELFLAHSKWHLIT